MSVWGLHELAKLGGSFWIVRNLGLWRNAKLRGANLGRWKLGSMHMRNLERAIAVFAKLRGCPWKLRVLFRCMGVVCALVAFSFYSSLSFFSAFVHLGNFCRGEGTQNSAFLGFVYIFRSRVRVGAVGRCRAVGGSSDGGVKGNPLNYPLKTSVSRFLFCYYLTKRGFLQKSRPLLNSLNRHAAIALTTRSWWISSASI